MRVTQEEENEQKNQNLCVKRLKNRKKLPLEHLIGCQGVKLFLLKYVTTAIVTTVTIPTVTI